MENEDLLTRFFAYVKCDSESRHERRFGELLEKDLIALGMTTRRQEMAQFCGSDGFNLHAYLDGEGEPLLFSAHLDTVSPGIGIAPFVKDGIIRAGGDTILGADDKAGIAAVVEALSRILARHIPHRPVEFLFTVCEETGTLGAKHADFSMVQSRSAVVLDGTTPGLIITQMPAYLVLHISVQGQGAHAALNPEDGIHALKTAAAAVNAIPCGRVDANTVVNISNFLSPGPSNRIAEVAGFDAEIRSFSETSLAAQRSAILGAVTAQCEKSGAHFSYTEEHLSVAVNTPETSPLVAQIREAYLSMGIEAGTDRTYGGCDAGWFAAHGLQVVNLGTGMCNVHTTCEQLAVSDLMQLSTVLYRLMCGESDYT